MHQGKPKVNENDRFVRKVSVGLSQKDISSLGITGCKAIEPLAVALEGIAAVSHEPLD